MGTRQRKVVQLSPDLEHAILHGILVGVVQPKEVQAAELSKLGRLAWKSMSALLEQKVACPIPVDHVILSATDLFGAEKASFTKYIVDVVESCAGDAPTAILRKVRDKQVLLDVLNEVTNQLSSQTLDVGLIGGLLEREAKIVLEPVSGALATSWPDPPQGLQIRSLPRLTEKTGGIHGLWALAGSPGSGKSTFAWQIALDVGRHTPVLIYDFENGFRHIMERTREIFNGDIEKAKTALDRVYYRDSIRSLDYDLAAVGSPALIIVDSVQKLPGSIEFRKAGLDRWVHRLELLKHRGYFVLLVSEVGRAMYEADPYIGAYKETGEIEYAADVGAQLIESGGDLVELHIVKNRHRPFRGLVAPLQRRAVKWLWKEIGHDEGRQEID